MTTSRKRISKNGGGQIYILTNSFPCQPFSVAGKQKGTDDSRYLWDESLRAIQEIQPEWAVSENVSGLVNWNKGMVFDKVQSDLEASGYEVIPFILPACGVNAPHKRDRIWFVAHSTRFDSTLSIQQRGQNQTKNINTDREREYRIITNTESRGARGLQYKSEETGTPESNVPLAGESGISGHESVITNASGFKLQRSEFDRGIRKEREAQRESRQSRGSIRSKWEEFPTQSPLCGRDDGLPSRLDGITFPKWRNESIKAYGNAIVPALALQIFKAIEMYDNLEK